MNFIPALPNWGLYLLGLIPLGIVLLYFLKLRRQPLTVPSTFLWQRTIEDLHVNSLIQRLRNNLLLILQLLFMLLLLLAVLRPGWQGENSAGRRIIFLLDASASMAATDMQAGQSRFAHAQDKIVEQIAAMGSDDQAMLIAFSDRADILQEFTNDQARLTTAVKAAEVSSRATDMGEALRAAAGLANPNRTSQAGDVNDVQVADAAPADLLIYSDGRMDQLNDFSLGNLSPTYHMIGSRESQNVAIVAFHAERNVEQPDRLQVFAQLANFGERTMDVVASLTMNDELIEAASVTLTGGDQQGLPFTIEAADASELTLTLEGSDGKPLADDLQVDNVAYAALAPARDVSVLLITPGNTALELALGTRQATKLGIAEVRAPDYLQSEQYQQRVASGRDDLIIYDRCSPATMPPANTFFIGAMPPGEWQQGELTGPILPIDIDRTHPIMRYLELFSLRIVEGYSLTAPRGATTLISADVGPVLAIAPRDGLQDLVMGFEIISEMEDGATSFNTDWPVQRSWPVFVFNAMRFLGGAVDTSGATTVRPGETVPLRVDNRLRAVRVENPRGDRETLSVGPAGSAPFADTDRTGLYRVTPVDEEDVLSLFTVNLFDLRESEITPQESIELGYETIEGTIVATPQRSEAWRWLLLGCLGILATEWLIFNRRLL